MKRENFEKLNRWARRNDLVHGTEATAHDESVDAHGDPGHGASLMNADTEQRISDGITPRGARDAVVDSRPPAMNSRFFTEDHQAEALQKSVAALESELALRARVGLQPGQSADLAVVEVETNRREGFGVSVRAKRGPDKSKMKNAAGKFIPEYHDGPVQYAKVIYKRSALTKTWHVLTYYPTPKSEA